MPEERMNVEGKVFVENMPTRLSVFTENEISDMLLQAHNRGQRPTVVLVEDDGTLRTWSIQVYLDANGNERVGLIDTNRVPWSRTFEGYIQIDGVELTGAEAALWTPGTAAAQLYEVFYHAVNIDAASAVVALTIGHGVGGGALGDPGYWARAEVLGLGVNTGWRGPWVIGGDDTVRGNAAAANDVAVSFRVRQVDVGA